MMIAMGKDKAQLSAMGIASYWIKLWENNILADSYWLLIDRRNDLYMYIRKAGADESRRLLRILDEVISEINKHPFCP